MFVDTHYTSDYSLAGRLGLWLSRFLQVLQPSSSRALPAELRRLPDRLLRDIGVERSALPPTVDELMTRADMLESRTAVAIYLNATTR